MGFIPFTQRQDMLMINSELDLLARYVKLGVEDNYEHYLVPPTPQRSMPRIYTHPYSLPAYPYGLFRRWVIEHNRADGGVGVEDWIVNTRPGFVGAWAVRSTLGAFRDETSPPVFGVTSPTSMTLTYGKQYEAQLSTIFGLEMEATESELDEFLAETKPFLGGNSITLRPGQPGSGVTRTPYWTPFSP